MTFQVIFVAGGSFRTNPETYSSNVHNVYKLGPGNLTSLSWRTLPESLPSRIAHAKMAVIGNRIWVISGLDNQGKYPREVTNFRKKSLFFCLQVLEYIPTSEKWLQVKTISSRPPVGYGCFHTYTVQIVAIIWKFQRFTTSLCLCLYLSWKMSFRWSAQISLVILMLCSKDE